MEKAMLDEMAVDKDEEAEMEENLVHEGLEADTEKNYQCQHRNRPCG